jgi:transposase InsO family protein
MLAIVRSLAQWRAELQGAPHKLEIYTDHKALEYFMSSKALTARQARWSETLSQFFFQIMYRPGKKNELADALSRREQELDSQTVLKEHLRYRPLLTPDQLSTEVQEGLYIAFLEPTTLIDSILRHNRKHPSLDTWRYQAAGDAPGQYTLEDGLLLYQGRLVVADVDEERRKLIQEAHTQLSTAHPGNTKTIALLTARYHWHGLVADVERFIRNCACRASHHARDKTPGLYHPLPVPEHPWQHICMDFKSFPPDEQGYDYVCVFVDRLSKAAVSIPCKKTITAKGMAELYYTYIYRYYDLPDSIVSDRGPQFVSDFWNALCAILGVQVKLSTANSPQTDGQTENLNQYIDQRLRPFINHYQNNWSSMLPAIDNAQLILPHESIGTSPFYLSRGYSPRRSFDWQAPKPAATAKEKLALAEAEAFAKRLQSGWETARKLMGAAQERKAHFVNKSRREPDFGVGDKVWLSTKNLAIDRPSRKLAKLWDGPYTILAKEGYSYRLDLPEHMKIYPVIHARFLRKAANDPLPGQTNPPPEPLVINGDKEWEVESLLAVRLHYGKLKYKVKWEGADEDPAEYPAGNFKYSPHKLRDFHLAHPELPGPPENLNKWLKAWEEGLDAYEELEGQKEGAVPMVPSSRASFFRRGG